MANDGDTIEITGIMKYAQNDNGKTSGIDFGTDNLVSYFTDSLISDQDVILRSRVSRKSISTQYAENQVIRNGSHVITTTTPTQSLANPVTINLWGQDTVSSAADITARQLEIIYYAMVAGTIVPTSNLKNGVVSLLAGVNYPVIFATAFGSAAYTLNVSGYDVYGNQIQVNLVPGSQAAGGFIIVAGVDCTANYVCVL